MSKSLIVSVVFLGLLLGCAIQPVKPTKEVGFTLVHQSNRQGVLTPCGCHTNPFGGIDREANAVRQMRQEGRPLWYVDSGNAFVPRDKKGRVALLGPKAKTLIGMLNTMGMDALSPGPFDYAMGLSSLREVSQQAKFPFVSTNVMDLSGKTLFEKSVILEKNGLKIAFVSATPSETFVGNREVKVADPDEILPKLLSELRKKSDLIVLLSQMGSARDEVLAEKHDVDIIVGADPALSSEQAFSLGRGKTLYVLAASFGFRLGRLDVDLKLPFQGFSSAQAIAGNLEELGYAEKRAEKNPSDEKARAYAVRKKERLLLNPIAGGSDYRYTLLPLDKERFGASNEITKAIQKEHERVRRQALSE